MSKKGRRIAILISILCIFPILGCPREEENGKVAHEIRWDKRLRSQPLLLEE